MGTTMMPPAVELAARANLAKASAVRKERRALLARIKVMNLVDGLRFVADAVEDIPAVLAGMAVFDLLCAIPRFQERWADEMMDANDIGPIATLRELSEGQCAGLAVLLRYRAARSEAWR